MRDLYYLAISSWRCNRIETSTRIKCEKLSSSQWNGSIGVLHFWEAKALQSQFDEDIMKHLNIFILSFLISSFRQSKNINQLIWILCCLGKMTDKTINIADLEALFSCKLLLKIYPLPKTVFALLAIDMQKLSPFSRYSIHTIP